MKRPKSKVQSPKLAAGMIFVGLSRAELRDTWRLLGWVAVLPAAKRHERLRALALSLSFRAASMKGFGK